MQKQTTDYFQPEDCLSEEQILNYLNGKMSPYEQHKAEMHLLDCELCSDALEGIQIMKNPNDLKTINADLKQNIVSYLEEEEENPKVKVMFPWRIAAAFALIFVSAATLWIVLPKNNSEKMFTQEYKPYPAPQNTAPLSIDSASALATSARESQIATDQNIIQDSKTNKKVAEKAIHTDTKESVNSIKDEAYSPNEIQATGIKEDNETSVQEASGEKAVAFSDSKVANTPSAPANAASADQVHLLKDKKLNETETKATQSKRSSAYSAREESAKIEFFEQAMSLYKNEKFSAAAGLFDQVKDTPDALFYSGVSYLSSDQPHIAIKRLQDYRKTNSSTYIEASWWYEGLANLKIDHKNDAQNALKQVLKFKGEHFEKAQELLRKL